MSYDVVLKNASILQADGTLQQLNIGIKNKIISYMGTEAIQGTEVLEAQDHLAVPGMVNAHTHIAMTLLRSYADDMVLMDWLQNKIWPAENNLQRQDFYWGTMLGVIEMLKSGTTAFADMYFEMDVTAEVVAQTGIKASLSRGLVGGGPDEDAKLAENVTLFKKWHNQADGRIKVLLGPHAPYTCSVPYLRKIIAQAQELQCGLHMHLAETKGEVENCLKEHQLTPIALMDSLGMFEQPTLAAHCVHVNAEDIAIMAAKKVSVAHNPQSNLKLASGIAPIAQMLAQGVNVALGTDGASSNNNLDMLEEARLAALLSKTITGDPTVVPADQALRLATSNGAAALGFTNTGVLEVGKQADIVLYDMDQPYWYPRHNSLSNLIYGATSADVTTVLVDGRILMKKKELLGIDVEKAYAEAELAGKRIVSKA